jgi:hypothetical protein
MALFCERPYDHLGVSLIIACYDELVVECPEESGPRRLWLPG